jgi:AraC-like DNA-binding protein
MDLMSQALDQLRLRRATYREQHFTAPWSLPQPEGAAGLYVVLGGRSLLTQGSASYSLDAGDLVILPLGSAHVVSSPPRSQRGATSELLSGALEFEAPDHPLLGVLPSVIHATPERLRENPRYALYLRQLVEEARSELDGSDALATRLTEVLFIEAMRFFPPPPGVECPVGGWFSGLSDPAVRRALSAIHEEPGRDWTVDALAKLAGKSRSAFAAHFTHVMRETPAGYLTRWRMFQGRALLRQTDLSLDDIAQRVGYGSAAAFSLAFVRAHGAAPGTYRKQHLAQLSGRAPSPTGNSPAASGSVRKI